MEYEIVQSFLSKKVYDPSKNALATTEIIFSFF